MYRQDSLEQNQQKDLEDRFERVMRMVRRETNGNKPEIEERAKEIYFLNNDKTAIAAQKVDPAEPKTKEPVKRPVIKQPQPKDAVAQAPSIIKKTSAKEQKTGVKKNKNY